MIATTVETRDGRREAWVVINLVGGWVCAEPDQGFPGGICGMPVESEPCNTHHPAKPVWPQDRAVDITIGGAP